MNSFVPEDDSMTYVKIAPVHFLVVIDRAERLFGFSVTTYCFSVTDKVKHMLRKLNGFTFGV